MNRLTQFIIGSVFSLTIVSSHCATINIYSWSGFLPAEVLREFTQETGIRVNDNHYESNEELYTKLKTGFDNRYDIIMPSGYIVGQMSHEKMLHQLDKKRIVNFKNLDTHLLDKAYDPGNQYSVPYIFHGSGLVVNTAYHKLEDFQSWESLWKVDLKNKILMLDDVREVFSIALLTLNLSPNTLHLISIKAAYEKLRALLPNIRVFNNEGIAGLYADEDLTLGVGWSGDIYRAQQLNQNLQFVYPKEGYILSIDNLVIPAGARNIDAAYRLINFLLRPEIAAKISCLTGYAVANQAAHAYLPKEMLKNPMLYPNQTIFRKGIVQLSASSQTTVYEKYWELLKIAG